MRFNILSAISLLLAVATAGCADDELTYPGQNGGEAAEASPLRFEVNPFTVNTGDSSSRSAEPSATPEPESDSERKIRDFWLFQFNPDGTRLANPAYYSIPKDGATLDDLSAAAFNNLTKNKPMTIFVVTNTGSPEWVGSGADFDTLAKVKEQALPSPFPIQAGIDSDNNGVADDIYIPMSGQLDNVTVKDKGLIVVPVTRMYAKVKIQVNFKEPRMDFYYANVSGIPWYCTVGPQSKGLADNGEPAAVPFPENTRMISRAFRSDEAVSDAAGNKWLVLYIPETIRGEIDDADKNKSTNIPKDALTVTISTKYDGADFFYTVYPGENTKNNFNVRRNRVYRVNIGVINTTDQHNPSSNCYVVKPGCKLSFEPYNREEKGGGYKFSTYLNPADPSKAINRVGIIWQTKDCIGDNSNGDLVRYVADTENPINSKIIIEKTGVEGNALIGAYNADGVIIWSWHIWVTPNEPDNLANAVVYTTYRWDSNGIYNNEPRIPGYGIMPCNLGALAFRSEDDMPFGEVRVQTGETTSGYDYIYTQLYSLPAKTKFPDSQIRTFGMMYQWGRKDPFPPMICSTGTEDANGTLDYDNVEDHCGKHYGNDNSTEVKKSDRIDGPELFHSAYGASRYRGVQYSIEHPTVYMTGTNILGYLSGGGDWCYPTDNKLWGGLDPEDPKVLTELNVGDNIKIYDNYGEKSIFDPCPRGWRVPPGDLWMSFTLTGKNPSDFNQDVNYCKAESGHRPGLSMYVQAWADGPTTYFPMQGTRAINGRFKNVGLCGNYHNATCASDTRVNILHFHRDMSVASNNHKNLMLFKVFETLENYVAKSTAGPIRCVRESK